MLETPKEWTIAQRFFPISGNAGGWRVWATGSPNRYIANIRGFYIHLSNRVSSTWIDGHLSSVEVVLNAIASLPLGPDEEIRPRAIFYDDKNGLYKWDVDLLIERGREPTLDIEFIKNRLGDGTVIYDDGQIYVWDVTVREVWRIGDNYDPDHYSFYEAW